jgi:hypothetical protein
MEIKPNDVFRFYYSRETLDESHSDLNWCFQGQLIALPESDGSIILGDTYWDFDGRGGRQFTIGEAKEKGVLTFYFNLDKVESVGEHERFYYKDEDIFDLSRQHSCHPSCIKWFKRKGAERDRETILNMLRENRKRLLSKIDYLIRDLERNAVDEAKVESGDLTGSWYHRVD